jgi:hypothetical protein
LIAFLAIYSQSPLLAAQFAHAGGWSAPGLYAAVFSWASIQTGFLFAVYTFIVPRAEPFVTAVGSTPAFQSFKRYMLRTTHLTLLVAVPAFGLMVVNPNPAPGGLAAFAMAAWLALFVYSILCFLKVIRTFRKLERTRQAN